MYPTTFQRSGYPYLGKDIANLPTGGRQVVWQSYEEETFEVRDGDIPQGEPPNDAIICEHCHHEHSGAFATAWQVRVRRTRSCILAGTPLPEVQQHITEAPTVNASAPSLQRQPQLPAPWLTSRQQPVAPYYFSATQQYPPDSRLMQPYISPYLQIRDREAYSAYGRSPNGRAVIPRTPTHHTEDAHIQTYASAAQQSVHIQNSQGNRLLVGPSSGQLVLPQGENYPGRQLEMQVYERKKWMSPQPRNAPCSSSSSSSHLQSYSFPQ